MAHGEPVPQVNPLDVALENLRVPIKRLLERIAFGLRANELVHVHRHGPANYPTELAGESPG